MALVFQPGPSAYAGVIQFLQKVNRVSVIMTRTMENIPESSVIQCVHHFSGTKTSPVTEQRSSHLRNISGFTLNSRNLIRSQNAWNRWLSCTVRHCGRCADVHRDVRHQAGPSGKRDDFILQSIRTILCRGGSLLCSVLSPTAFEANEPPHLCGGTDSEGGCFQYLVYQKK